MTPKKYEDKEAYTVSIDMRHYIDEGSSQHMWPEALRGPVKIRI